MLLSLEALTYFLLILVAVLVGTFVPLLSHALTHQLPLFLSLSAGLMLGSSFFHLIPESIEQIGSYAGPLTLAGLLFLYFFEKFITVHICEEREGCEVHHLGLSAFIGLFLHAITDGIALGVGLHFPEMGLVVFLAIFAHKGLEAFSLSSILIHTKTPKSKILLANLALLLAVPLGAFAASGLISTHNHFLAGASLAFAAGTFLHISLSDLLPEVHRHSNLKLKAMISLSIGLALMWGLRNFI